MLSTDIMNSELAEALLFRKGFSTEDYALIIASLTSKNVRMNKDIANRFCALYPNIFAIYLVFYIFYWIFSSINVIMFTNKRLITVNYG